MTAASERRLANRFDSLIDRGVAAIARLDPAPRPAPISHAFLVCFAAGVVLTIWLLVTNKYLPGQDISYHAHGSRVWIDGGQPGSPYARYEPGHPLEANTLMYSVSALFSHVLGSFTAYRFVQSYYFIGLPLVSLYALRALDRSPWGSLLAFPLCYIEVFAAGYANMAFAAPTFLLALVEYRRFTLGPTWRRGVFVALLFTATFLSHAHVYLWLGGLVLLYSLVILGVRAYQTMAGGPLAGARQLGVVTASALAVATPSLVLFYRWYARGYGQGNSIGGQGNGHSFSSSLEWAPIDQKFMNGALQAFHATPSTHEVPYMIALGLLVMFALAMARAGSERTAPLPELAIIASVISFFCLPDGIAGQMVAVRQWYFALWLLPLVVVPIAVERGAIRSVAVTAALLAWSIGRMTLVTQHLQHFKAEDMAGFDDIVAAAPREPGLTVAYAAVNARSRYWLTSPMYHSYGFLDAQRSYDGPVEYSDSRSVAPIRYKDHPPFPVKHLYGNPNWFLDPVIWQYDLVLVYRWVPTPTQQKGAEERGTLIAASGQWQLWRSKHH
jgi:hypothetical protein